MDLDRTPVTMASAAAEEIRALNHRTLDTKVFTQPADVSECLPEDDDSPETIAERAKHSGPNTAFCVLCLSGEHERVDDKEAGRS